MEISNKRLLLLGTLVLSLIFGVAGFGDPLIVDGDDCGEKSDNYCTIQAAVDDANSGDTIKVAAASGSYGPFIKVTKNVEIVSKATGPKPWIMSSPMGVFIPSEGSNSSLSGFAIAPYPDHFSGTPYLNSGFPGNLMIPQGLAGVTLTGISSWSLEGGQLANLFSDPVENVEIYSNEIANNLLGVGLLHATNNQIGFADEEKGGNYVHNNAIGIGLLGADQVTWPEELNGNLPFNLPTSLLTEGNYIEGNTVTHNGIGIGLLGASNNFINNNLSYNEIVGITEKPFLAKNLFVPPYLPPANGIGIGPPWELTGGISSNDLAGIGIVGIEELVLSDSSTNEKFLSLNLPAFGNEITNNNIAGNGLFGVGLLGASDTLIKDNNSVTDLLFIESAATNIQNENPGPGGTSPELSIVIGSERSGISWNGLAGIGIIGIKDLDFKLGEVDITAEIPATGNEIINNNISYNELFGVGLLGASDTLIKDNNSVTINLFTGQTVPSSDTTFTRTRVLPIFQRYDRIVDGFVGFPFLSGGITGNGLAGIGIIGVEKLEIYDPYTDEEDPNLSLSASLPATGNEITNNNISSNFLFGVGLLGASDTLIKDNNSANIKVLSGDSNLPEETPTGVVKKEFTGITANMLAGVGIIGIEDFTISGSNDESDPLLSASLPATGNEIINNNISHNRLFGVGLLGASDNLIKGNNINDNLIGIGAIGIEDATGLDNQETLLKPFPFLQMMPPIGYGYYPTPFPIEPNITFDISMRSQNNIIQGNTVNDNDLVGIGLLNSDGTIVESNTITKTSTNYYENSADSEVNALDQPDPFFILQYIPGIGIALSDADNTIIRENIVANNDVGILAIPNLIEGFFSPRDFNGTSEIGVPTDNSVHFNSITGNKIGIGLEPLTLPSEERLTDNWINATLNYWGSPDGPTVDWEGDGDIDYDGGGDTIIAPEGSVPFSPWLADSLPGDKDGIDTDPDIPGVQLPSSVNIIVDDVGPEPEGGYLITALDAAASSTLPNPDTIYVRTHEDPDGYNPVTGRVIQDNITIPTGHNGSGLTINYNTFAGLLTHNGSGTVDALLNYWGSPPNVDGKIENILLSPWLLEEPGTDNMRYKVATMGANPEGGLTRAIADANDDRFEDEIIVDEGTYNVSDSTGVTEPTDIVSCTGCPTTATINGELLIEASKVNIGGWEEDTYDTKGFNINGDVTIEGGVDASTIHINWNNIYGTVTNDATGTLDATYNWWGGANPEDSTEGPVDYTPALPDTVCSVLDYMEKNGIENPKAAIAGMVCGGGSSSEQAVCQLTGMGLDVDGASNLLGQYGLGRVTNAMNNANTSGQFVQLLNGFSLPAGAAGGLTNNTVAGGAGSVGDRTVGAVFTKCDTIEVGFPLADFEGNPATNLVPTVSLVRLDEDGNKKGLTKVTTATYDEEEAAYVTSISSCELTPGYYLVQIDLPDQSSLEQVIEIEGEKASA